MGDVGQLWHLPDNLFEQRDCLVEFTESVQVCRLTNLGLDVARDLATASVARSLPHHHLHVVGEKHHDSIKFFLLLRLLVLVMGCRIAFFWGVTFGHDLLQKSRV